MDAIIKKLSNDEYRIVFDVKIENIALGSNSAVVTVSTPSKLTYRIFGDYDNPVNARKIIRNEEDGIVFEILKNIQNKTEKVNPLTDKIFKKIVNQAFADAFWDNTELDDEEAYKKMK